MTDEERRNSMREASRRWKAKHPEYGKRWLSSHPGYMARWRAEDQQRPGYREKKLKESRRCYAALLQQPEKLSAKIAAGKERAHRKYHTSIEHRLRTRADCYYVKACNMQGANKVFRGRELLGCTISEFVSWLESHFEPGMTWENYAAVWEMDHIIPSQCVDLRDTDSQRVVFHHTNIRPLSVELNRERQTFVRDADWTAWRYNTGQCEDMPFDHTFIPKLLSNVGSFVQQDNA